MRKLYNLFTAVFSFGMMIFGFPIIDAIVRFIYSNFYDDELNISNALLPTSMLS